ncbi:MAG: glycosyltransferase family 4 protein [bacterium]
MRIVFIGPYGRVGGAEKVMRRDIEVLSKSGHDIAVVYGDRMVADDLQPRVRKCYLRDMRPDFTINGGGSKKLWESVVELEPDIVHFHTTEIFGDRDTISKIILTFPTIVTIHNYYLLCPKNSKSLALKDGRVCSRHVGPGCLIGKYLRGCSDHSQIATWKRYLKVKANVALHTRVGRIVVVNDYMKRMIARVGIAPEKIAVVVPSVSDVERVEVEEQSCEEGRVLFVGRLVPNKGVEYLLQASSYLSESHRIVIVGDGPERERLVQMAVECGIEKRVEFAGEIDGEHALRCEYLRACVVVVPSVLLESLVLVGQEAVCMGRPVIATDVGGIPESGWCEDGRNGYLVRSRDARALADALGKVLGDREKAHEMGRESRRMALERFRPAGHRRALEALYEACRSQQQS